MFGVIGFLVAGLVVAALARVLTPGRQHLSMLATLGLGVAGSLVGGVGVAEGLTGGGDE